MFSARYVCVFFGACLLAACADEGRPPVAGWGSGAPALVSSGGGGAPTTSEDEQGADRQGGVDGAGPGAADGVAPPRTAVPLPPGFGGTADFQRGAPPGMGGSPPGFGGTADFGSGAGFYAPR